MARTCGHWIPVLIVLAIIGSCYTIFTMDFLLKEVESDDLVTHERGVAYTIAFNVVFGLGLISFLRTIFDEPGRVPASWIVATEDEEEVRACAVGCRVHQSTAVVRSTRS